MILQIILTIVAWNRGWKWHSLIPIACTFTIGFFIGLSGGASNAAIFADILSIIALIVMCIVKPKTSQNPGWKEPK